MPRGEYTFIDWGSVKIYRNENKIFLIYEYHPLNSESVPPLTYYITIEKDTRRIEYEIINKAFDAKVTSRVAIRVFSEEDFEKIWEAFSNLNWETDVYNTVRSLESVISEQEKKMQELFTNIIQKLEEIYRNEEKLAELKDIANDKTKTIEFLGKVI